MIDYSKIATDARKKKKRLRNYEFRKFQCPDGHWFLSPIWVSYLNCPARCSKKADRVEDITVRGVFEPQENYGL